MMPANRKMVWAEGMLLGQQHFQQWDHYLHHQRCLIQQHIAPYNWGVAILETDDSFLPQGIFRLNRCVALLEDGRWIDFDSVFDEPLTVTIPKDAQGKLAIYLALPISESVAGITGYPTMGASAWEADYKVIHDQYDTSRGREICLSRQNLRLLLDDAPKDNLAIIKIAELHYDTNQLAFKSCIHYYPPLLKMNACPGMISWIAGFKSVLLQLIKRLNAQKMKHRHIQNQFGYSDFMYFNLIKTLTAHLPAFGELQRAPVLHPFHLYQACINLIGELWGFLDEPLCEQALPSYRHHAIADVFTDLKDRFVALIERVMPVNTVDIMLQKLSETQYQSASIVDKDLQVKHFCLAVYHEKMTQALIDKIGAQIKIAAPSQLNNIVTSFTQGIEFNYVAEPGKDLTAKRHYHYFLLDKQSQGWSDVVAEKKLAIFVSHDLISLPIELITY